MLFVWAVWSSSPADGKCLQWAVPCAVPSRGIQQEEVRRGWESKRVPITEDCEKIAAVDPVSLISSSSFDSSPPLILMCVTDCMRCVDPISLHRQPVMCMCLLKFCNDPFLRSDSSFCSFHFTDSTRTRLTVAVYAPDIPCGIYVSAFPILSHFIHPFVVLFGDFLCTLARWPLFLSACGQTPRVAREREPISARGSAPWATEIRERVRAN